MINIDQVLFADRHEFLERKSSGIKRNLLYVVNSLFFTGLRFPPKTKCQYLFVRSLVREDYKTLFNSIASSVPEKDKIIIEDYIRPLRFPALKPAILLLQLSPKFFSFTASSLFERLYLYLRLCFYYRQFAAINKISFKSIILFADMQPIENLLSQYFGSMGKTTITMQHGLYVDYGEYQTINKINYLHQPSEYFLSWGSDTKSLIQNHHRLRKVVICGNPVATKFKKIEPPPYDLKFFTVVLDQNIFEKQNIEMLNLMSEHSKRTGLKMNVRFHPYNKKERYHALRIEFATGLLIEHSEFVVGHTSSMIYELLYGGIPTFKFASEAPSLELPQELIFNNSGELESALNKKIDFHEIGKRFICISGEESIRAYSNFFSQIKDIN